MIPQRLPQLFQRLHLGAIVDRRALARDLAHQLADVFELFQRRPPPIAFAPVDIGIEPYGKRLGEVLNRVRLCIPAGKVDDMAPALRPRLVGFRIGLLRITEQLAVAIALVKLVGVVERVTRLVPENAPALRLAGALHLEHLAALQAHQARMREIEGDREAQHPIRREEFLRQPRVGKGNDVAG